MEYVNKMSDGKKTFCLMLVVMTAFSFGNSFSNELSYRILFSIPLLVLAVSQFVFRKPQFVYRYFYELAEKDSQRRILSIKNLGVLLIAVIGALFLFYGS